MPKFIKPEEAAIILSDVPEDKVFWCNDGRIFKNLRELADGLYNMTDDTYNYHANHSKNDFANWVKDVLHDEDLAISITKASSSSQSANVVLNRIGSLERKAKIVKSGVC